MSTTTATVWSFVSTHFPCTICHDANIVVAKCLQRLLAVARIHRLLLHHVPVVISMITMASVCRPTSSFT